MISFHYELDFNLEPEISYRDWIERIVLSEEYQSGEISYIFCDDEYLARLHKKYLNQDTLTDIITFDYTEEKTVAGDIFISVDRLKENAGALATGFKDELLRVMCHGLLHMMGYNDKSGPEEELMREKEDEKMTMFHVEH